MKRRTLAFRDESIGRFLDAIVEKRVGGVAAQDEPRADRIPECRVNLLFRQLVNQRQSGELGGVTETGKLLES